MSKNVLFVVTKFYSRFFSIKRAFKLHCNISVTSWEILVCYYTWAPPHLSSEQHSLLTPNTSCDLQNKVIKISLLLRDQQIQDLFKLERNYVKLERLECFHLNCTSLLNKVKRKRHAIQTFLLRSWISFTQFSLSVSASSHRAGSSSWRIKKQS